MSPEMEAWLGRHPFSPRQKVRRKSDGEIVEVYTTAWAGDPIGPVVFLTPSWDWLPASDFEELPS